VNWTDGLVLGAEGPLQAATLARAGAAPQHDGAETERTFG